ncbi:Os11g0284500 [Oryza sativa Japonica Group]|uniref:Os11g0284500 protein n=1 Tax=Oryza sativa subsp. japonica TaxID=39947 RepID=A0A0P0Y135_ORYSJ|nr:Os11g0284500 [Oryza sativa Japonica Group]
MTARRGGDRLQHGNSRGESVCGSPNPLPSQIWLNIRELEKGAARQRGRWRWQQVRVLGYGSLLTHPSSRGISGGNLLPRSSPL